MPKDLFAAAPKDLFADSPVESSSPSLDEKANDVVAESPGGKAIFEFASAANKSIVDLIDFFGPDAINGALGLVGSEAKVPRLGDAAEKVGIGANFMEPGLARDVVRGAGESATLALGAGQLARTAASKLAPAAAGESAGIGVARELGKSTAGQDLATGIGSGVGAELGEEVGGDTGKLVGSIAGGVGPALAKGVAQSAGRTPTKVLKDSAPTIDSLKGEARKLYKQVDDLGATVQSPPLQKLSSDIAKSVKREGFNARIHPKVSGALEEIAEQSQGDLTISEIDTVRKVARAAARSLDPDESRLGSIMVDKIDDFLDDIPESAIRNADASEVGSLLRDARGLWSRAKKSEIIEDAFEKARNQASGFENGLRTQFRSLLNNKKVMRGFTSDEKSALQKVVRGGKAENIAKLLGKFGFTEGQATSTLMSSLGLAAGVSVGGATGGVAVPLIGQAAKKTAQTLTKNNAELANAIVRSGGDGRKIAAAYLRNTPRGKQDLGELTGLLLGSSTSLAGLKSSDRPIVANAAYFASVINSVEPENGE